MPVQQTGIVYVANANMIAWTTGLFDCFDNPVNGLAFLSDFYALCEENIDKLVFFFHVFSAFVTLCNLALVLVLISCNLFA